MPFKSQAQRGYMYIHHPELAKEFEEATPKGKQLPEHVAHMADGGLVKMNENDNGILAGLYRMLTGQPNAAIKSDKTEASAADAIDPVIQTSSDTPKGYAEGGDVDKNEPGIQDATVTDFLLPTLLGKGAGVMEGAGERLGSEAGALFPESAPEMEGMASKIQPYSKGVMGKGTKNEMTIWGVKGDPEAIAKLGYGPDPASIPEHVLKSHGILPEISIKVPNQPAPNSYAQGGMVMPDLKGSEFDPDAPYPTQSQGDEGLPSMSLMDAFKGAANDVMGPTTDVGDIIAARLSGSPVTAPQVNQEQLAGMRPQAPQIPMPPTGGMPTPPASQPPTNPITQASQAMRSMPSTNPSIYQGISAEDRANLMKQLLASRTSGGNMLASGAGGLADAITAGFGKSPTNFQQNIRNSQQQNLENQVGIVDTERQQKIQDIQANIATQESDPNSPYSQGMRNFLQLQGMKVPSGMSAAMLKQTLPDVTKLFDTKVVAATAAGAQGIEAAKALFGETFADFLKESLGMGGVEAGETALRNKVEGTTNRTAKTPLPGGGSYSVRK